MVLPHSRVSCSTGRGAGPAIGQHRRGGACFPLYGARPQEHAATRERRAVTSFRALRHVDCAAVKLRLPGRRADPDTTPDAATADRPRSCGVGGRARAGRRPSAPRPRAAAPGRRHRRRPPARRPTGGARRTQAAGRAASRAGRRARDDSAPARPGTAARCASSSRDIVDSRRNVGSFFLVDRRGGADRHHRPSAAVAGLHRPAASGFFLVFSADSFVLGRKIKRTVAERFPGPDDPTRGSLVQHQPVHHDPPLAVPEAHGRLGARGLSRTQAPESRAVRTNVSGRGDSDASAVPA